MERMAPSLDETEPDVPSKGAVPMVSLGATEQIFGGGPLLSDSR